MWIGSETAAQRHFHSSFKRRAVLYSSLGFILFASIFLIKQNPFPNSQSQIKPLESPQKLPQSPVPNSQSEIKPLESPPKLPQNQLTFSSKFNPSLYHTNGTEVIYQIPDSPKAVLFIAHGCTIHAYDFWDKSPNCSHCTGLPEERIFVLQALEKNIAVLTISSLGECWTFTKEMENVEWIIKNWVETNNLGNLPKFAIGASSGGYFVSALATKIEFNSICIMIAEGVFEQMDIPKNYPPTLFVHMAKDKIRASLIRSNMAELMEKGIDVKEIRCEEFPVDADFLAKRVPGLEIGLTVKLIEVLREKRFLDDKGYLKKDGRDIKWKEALVEKKLIDEKFELFRHINEELNVAYSYHEYTSLKNDEIFEWFESHMKGN
ncbi:Secretion-regulating guanine nucleotide exchange factor [Rhynchospora pubera]|uniref:Secretion-regulating guanine nucleotide exchange factor n=1 Tax=Rhynchospora pubera TaxID=906938 RepID=A0AAV8FDH5_9POAL|nr:Secretion-regulating guanine nucleotide exchange factor [Rhynchospora pubera]